MRINQLIVFSSHGDASVVCPFCDRDSSAYQGIDSITGQVYTSVSTSCQHLCGVLPALSARYAFVFQQEVEP